TAGHCTAAVRLLALGASVTGSPDPNRVRALVDTLARGDRSTALALHALVCAANEQGVVDFEASAKAYRDDYLAALRAAGPGAVTGDGKQPAIDQTAPVVGGSVLEAKGLVKTYRRRRVVNDVALRLQQGEIVGLLGPNGAGKTTTFYMIVGLIQPLAGTIVMDGEDITTMPMYKRARRGVGYLSQEPSIFRKLSV